MDTELPTHELHRNLKNRHIQLIALGGAIGTGLFYGSATTIKLVGPGIIVSYLLGGIVIFLIMRALGEMAVDEPVSGSFSHYAYRYWGDFPGFLAGWNYWFNYIIVGMAELTAVGAYMHFWWPGLPVWISAFIFWVLITLVNLVNVKAFGEFEFWFALIKVVAIIAMIVLGIVLIFMGFGHTTGTPMFSNLWIHGGFFPNGISGLLFSLVIVMFSFGGTELIGITAGEADNPSRSIPKAVNQVMWRILIFYIGSLAVIVTLYPWNKIGTTGSPFVEIFSNVGIPAAAFILNIVVITAAMSTFNSGLYSNGRMLYGLAKQGNAPRFFAYVSKPGAPIVGILFSSALVFLTVLINYVAPKSAFLYLVSVATAALIINWVMILIAHVKFRQQKDVSVLKFRMPGFPLTSYVSLAFLALVVVMMAIMPEMRLALYIGLIWMVILYIAYKIKNSIEKKSMGSGQADHRTIH
ncbi:amino acid permease [Alicyclobacillaceae bacterium I2511]|nr:amino acid permease [Alicyclobacillaceae bacterium I2511]